MDQASIEAAFSRSIAAGQMTHQEADELHRWLGLLAFNMTVAGQEGQVPRAAADYWLFHLRTRKLARLPQASQEEQGLASQWWALGERAGLLRQSENTLLNLRTYEDRTIIRPAISALETLRDPRAREPLLNHLSRWDYLTARMAMHAADRLPVI